MKIRIGIFFLGFLAWNLAAPSCDYNETERKAEDTTIQQFGKLSYFECLNTWISCKDDVILLHCGNCMNPTRLMVT